MSLVLDSSVALAWCFEDERTEVTDALLRQVAASGAIAPSPRPLEVLNALAMGEKRGRFDVTQRERLGGFLRDLPVTIDDETALQTWNPTARLAARFQLTRLRRCLSGTRATPRPAAGHARPCLAHRGGCARRWLARHLNAALC